MPIMHRVSSSHKALVLYYCKPHPLQLGYSRCCEARTKSTMSTTCTLYLRLYQSCVRVFYVTPLGTKQIKSCTTSASLTVVSSFDIFVRSYHNAILDGRSIQVAQYRRVTQPAHLVGHTHQPRSTCIVAGTKLAAADPTCKMPRRCVYGDYN